MKRIYLIFGAPFRFVAGLNRICVGVGLGLFVMIYNLFLAAIGLTFIVFVGYAFFTMLRASLFH